MLTDGWRYAAYAKAIAHAVRPGDAVAEIGCGPAVFSLLACQAGARRVYAIESEDAIQFAKPLAAANGFADRIEFIQSDSRKVELPERVNVIVSDIRGTLPLAGSAIPSLEDARRRLLAPGGVMIPQRDTLMAAVVEAREYYEGLVAPWRSRDGLELASSLPLVLNERYSASFKPEQLLSAAQSWRVLDYAKGAASHACGKLQIQIEREGTAHGLCVWFETELLEGIGYSSGPGGASNIYGQAFLPWLEPAQVSVGDEIQTELHADPVGKDYVWRWNTKIGARGAEPRSFQQSTFQGANFAQRSLQRHAADFTPQLSELGEAERWILQAMNGNTSLRAIAEDAAKRFPKLFSGWNEAFERVAELSGKYSR